jgi:hypothetical protein
MQHDEKEDGNSTTNNNSSTSPTTTRTRRYFGFRNAGTFDRQAPQPLFIRKLSLSILPESIGSVLREMDTSNLPMIILGEEQDSRESVTLLPATDRESIRSLQKYRDECQRLRTRAQKFGLPYHPPALDTILPWSQARRLVANPSSHAVIMTGINITSDTERIKQEQRKARFGNTNLLLETADEKDIEEPSSPNKQEPNPDENNLRENKEASASVLLTVEQAWDKIDTVGKIHRVDPPPNLWKDPVSNDDNPEQPTETSFFQNASQQPAAVLVPEKIHICSIDWAAFKQIRSQDLRKYFADYGPSYVEWLGDLSCNVQFEDPFSAARAMEHLSMELPSPPPPPVSFDDSNAGQPEDMEENDQNLRPDLGRMGWRLGKKMLQKISNDKYGRKGTCARILMRVATSMDILVERPNQWPKPPPGFSTKRVLGPQSDLPQQRKTKNQREKRKRPRRKATSEKTAPRKTAEDRINSGLSSSREGFTLQEIEAERAGKRRRRSELSNGSFSLPR